MKNLLFVVAITSLLITTVFAESPRPAGGGTGLLMGEPGSNSISISFNDDQGYDIYCFAGLTDKNVPDTEQVVLKFSPQADTFQSMGNMAYNGVVVSPTEENGVVVSKNRRTDIDFHSMTRSDPWPVINVQYVSGKTPVLILCRTYYPED